MKKFIGKCVYYKGNTIVFNLYFIINMALNLKVRSCRSVSSILLLRVDDGQE